MAIRPTATDNLVAKTPRSFRTVWTRHLLVSSALALTLALPSAALAADTAKDVLTRVQSLYNNAKSFQGTITVQQNGKSPDGKPFSLKTVEQIKFQGPNQFRVQSTANGTGAAASFASQSAGMAISDGKQVYVYLKTQNQYGKQPAPASVQLWQVFKLLHALPQPNDPGASLLAPTTVQGRPAYVIQIKPTMPKNLPPAQQKQYQAAMKNFVPPKLLIDKKSYQILRMTAASNQIDVTEQIFNATIAPANFTFTPPAGAKEHVAPPPTPGAPGAPGTAAPGPAPGPAPHK